MKKILLSLALVIFTGSLYAQTKVAIVFDAGGKFDRSFNQAAWEGAKRAESDFKITLRDVEPADTTAVQEAMRNFAGQGYDLVLGIGFANASSVEKTAKEYPNIKFAIVDSRVDLPNVASLEFKEQEGSFLVGVVAGMASRKIKNNRKVVGFIGGMDIPLIHKFEVGFAQGAKSVDPNIDVLVNYVGNTPTAWNDPAKAKEIAGSQLSKGATVIYSAAGGSGAGLFDAIKEKNEGKNCVRNKNMCVYAIGVDSNQNYILPGQILTSMTKRVDVAVYNTIRNVVKDTFNGGAHLFGLASNGVGIAVDKHNEKLIDSKTAKAVEDYRKKIIDGSIVVNTTR